MRRELHDAAAIAGSIERFHDRALCSWYDGKAVEGGDAGPLAEAVLAQHRCNFELWALEDEVRRRDLADAVLVATKRSIDVVNQRRNDLTEQVDDLVLAEFSSVELAGSELHSETAGQMFDRLSILALKIRNFAVVAGGAEDLEVAELSRRRLKILETQRADLADCLRRLLRDFAAGKRHFKSYRQFKAYNDPRLSEAMMAGGKGG